MNLGVRTTEFFFAKKGSCYSLGGYETFALSLTTLSLRGRSVTDHHWTQAEAPTILKFRGAFALQDFTVKQCLLFLPIAVCTLFQSRNRLSGLPYPMNNLLGGNSPAYSILEFSKQSFHPQSIRRNDDGEIFSLGDRVSNGLSMCGLITKFWVSESDIFVSHSYSGVDMSVSSLQHVAETPSKFQQGDAVCINKTHWVTPVAGPVYEKVMISIPRAVVIKVHMTGKTVSYDLQVWLNNGDSTRLYNIEEKILEKQ